MALTWLDEIERVAPAFEAGINRDARNWTPRTFNARQLTYWLGEAAQAAVTGGELTIREAQRAVRNCEAKLRDHMGAPRPRTVAAWETDKGQAQVGAVVASFLDELALASADQASERAGTLPPRAPRTRPVDP